ncbi:MAG: DUF885 domain-containing protein [Gammaproteobacteria bacterium]|nr:DUF885 domain-containing protein [Gammaproteobacteria bacterium]
MGVANRCGQSDGKPPKLSVMWTVNERICLRPPVVRHWTGAWYAVVLALSVAASADGHAVPQPTVFQGYVERFIEDLWRRFPDGAMVAGRYGGVGRLVILDADTLAARHAFIAAERNALGHFDPLELGESDAADFAVIENFLDTYLWTARRLRPLTWRPDLYDVANGFDILLSRRFADRESRLRLAGERMRQVPGFYAAARANLTNPTLEHTDAAIARHRHNFGLFAAFLPAQIEASKLSSEEKLELVALCRRSAVAILQHGAWLASLRDRLAKDGARSSRLGGALFDEKFALEVGAGRNAVQVHELAARTRDEVHARMAPLAESLWPRYFPGTAWPRDPLVGIRRVLERLGGDQVTGGYLQTVEGQVAELREFVESRDLVELDPTRPLVLRKAPGDDVMAASVQAPGPYDPDGTTYYNIAMPAGGDLAREYNRGTLQILNMHEAMPGHYVQLTHSNRESVVSSIFRNPALTEGWGLYAERLMLEQGFGDHEPELWLLYYKWFLRSVTNAILDRDVHVHGIEREAAIRMLQHTAFQERAEAENKWRRAMVSQVQLSTYFSGFSEIYSRREELRTVQPYFDLKRFHSRFLGYGSIPARFIRERMLSP